MIKLKEHRKNLHLIPEIGFKEFKTQAYILETLQDFNCEINTLQPTGVVAYFSCNKKNSKTIGFRADMDALPVKEETGLSFSSNHEGYMHACGHDAHCSILLGLANHINENPSNINIALIFQPSEENEAGANVILNSGLLEKYKVECILGLHLWPGLDFGKVYTRANELMSASSETDIYIYGKSSHIANSDQAIDSLYVSTQFVKDLYDFEKNFSSETYRLLKFGKIESGTVRNVIASYAHLQGSLRTFYPDVHKTFKNFIAETAKKYEIETGCKIEIKYNDGYESVLNDENLYQFIKENISYIKSLEKPVMQAEDFGLYRKHCPILFSFLGIGDTPPLHANNFDFNMDVLEIGLSFFVDVIKLLEKDD